MIIVLIVVIVAALLRRPESDPCTAVEHCRSSLQTYLNKLTEQKQQLQQNGVKSLDVSKEIDIIQKNLNQVFIMLNVKTFYSNKYIYFLFI